MSEGVWLFRKGVIFMEGVWPTILQGDCRDVLKTLPDESVHCVITSPPY